MKVEKTNCVLGRSPGLVVMGGDSQLRGGGFKPQHRILNGHFLHHVGVIFYVCLKRPKINKKMLWMANFFKKKDFIVQKRTSLPANKLNKLGRFI